MSRCVQTFDWYCTLHMWCLGRLDPGVIHVWKSVCVGENFFLFFKWNKKVCYVPSLCLPLQHSINTLSVSLPVCLSPAFLALFTLCSV